MISRITLVLTATLLAQAPAYAQGFSYVEKVTATIGTEYKVFSSLMKNGDRACFVFKHAGTNADATVNLRRTENGRQRGLGPSTGGRCLIMHRAGGWYVVYVTPVSGDVDIYLTRTPPQYKFGVRGDF